MPCLRGMGAPKAKENTPRHVAEIPKKRSGPSPDSDSGLLQGCMSLQSAPDLTQMGVGAAYSEARIKSNYLLACHRTKFSKILCCKPPDPFSHAAKVIYSYIPDMPIFNSGMRRKVRLRRDYGWCGTGAVFCFGRGGHRKSIDSQAHDYSRKTRMFTKPLPSRPKHRSWTVGWRRIQDWRTNWDG